MTSILEHHRITMTMAVKLYFFQPHTVITFMNGAFFSKTSILYMLYAKISSHSQFPRQISLKPVYK